MPRVLGAALTVCALLSFSVRGDTPWPPSSGVPKTTWGKSVTPDKPVWPEYPRPQLVRENWLNLNGLWDYALVDKDAAAPTKYDGKILVPFPPQSILSQVNRPAGSGSRIWYHCAFKIPPAWSGQHLLLHFGAVNWETHVLLNGKEVGAHTGGYDGFTFDLTDALRSGEQDLVVSAWNPVEGGQPRGKQSSSPSGMYYTPTTGIWQTVWLEPVPTIFIDSLKLVSDIDAGQLQLTVNAPTAPGQEIEAFVRDGSTIVARLSGKTGTTLALPIPHPRLWWPGDPFLYDLTVNLKSGGRIVDSVSSYFGMRKISVGPDKSGRTHILLNNTFLFQLGLLDQGFWPDGIYTPPSDEAMRSDIEAVKTVGLNMLRKHVKVEPDRFYYWADKLGMLVWQDMPSSTEMGYGDDPKYVRDRDGVFESELRRMIQGRFNHPSIVVWIPFNEGWGFDTMPQIHPGDPGVATEISKAREKRMVDAVREEDTTRLIDPESGAGNTENQGANFWDIGAGDILDFHCYVGDGPTPEAHRASVIGEMNGGAWPDGELATRLKTTEQLGESAIVMTQLTDVENETNGALTYDRTPKYPLEPKGKVIIDKMHQAGYTNYPGGGVDPSAASSSSAPANP